MIFNSEAVTLGQKTDKEFNSETISAEDFRQPTYTPDGHYLDIAGKPYFRALLAVRHIFKNATDEYWGNRVGAKNMDLFMLTPSISSPMGPGSDSESIEIKFGNLNTHLVDSSQFGFEPMLMNGVDKVYCYLPSMRGENPDKRHINQFYHCEAEIRGTIEDLTPLIESYVKFLAQAFLGAPNLIKLISVSPKDTKGSLEQILSKDSFDRINFDKAIKLLTDNGHSHLIRKTRHGRILCSDAELALMKILNSRTPVWIENFDRDTVAFYQKPNPHDSDKVINADLIFPQITPDSFGGEVLGAGQRQDKVEEIIESLERQEIDKEAYDWYINLRKQNEYRMTSGFGLGVERFLTWMLVKDDIKDVIFYPRLKNVQTNP